MTASRSDEQGSKKSKSKSDGPSVPSSIALDRIEPYPFPVYCVRGANQPATSASGKRTKSDSESLIVLSGGGGAAKTGIPNLIVLNRWNQQDQKLELVETFDTALDAVMNVAIHPRRAQLAYGVGTKCISADIDDGRLKKVSAGQTDFLERDGEQKVVAFARSGDLVYCAGEGGAVVVLDFPSLEQRHRFDGIHSQGIQDLDVHPSHAFFATTARDGSCVVTDAKSGRPVKALRPATKGFLYRGCRFAVGGSYLYIGAYCPRKPSYLEKWLVDGWTLVARVKVHNHHHCCVGISPNDEYVAVGSCEGDVAIVATRNMRRLQLKSPHSFIVPSLCFTPDSTAVVSVSADKSVAVCGVCEPWWANLPDFRLLFATLFVILVVALFFVLHG